MDLYTYRVLEFRIIDGDTLEATLDLGFSTYRKEKIRLARINAPEMKTTEGHASKAHLSELVNNKSLIIQTKKDERDRYGRYIGEVWVEALNINDQMVKDNAAIYVTY